MDLYAHKLKFDFEVTNKKKKIITDKKGGW
jgi:hypothetical protein